MMHELSRGTSMQKCKLELGFFSKREIDQFIRDVRTPCENKIRKAEFRMASLFEKDLFEFLLEKKAKKVLSVRHTDYKWDEGRIDMYFKFFTEDEMDVAIDFAKNLGEYVIDYDLTKIAEMTDEEFMRLSYSYLGENDEIIRKWRNAVMNGK